MSHDLLITVRFHDGRYHGEPEWPPSPARLFQALIAAAGKNGDLTTVALNALQWLERLDPAFIAAPSARTGRRLTNYVPNNDLDSVGGDPSRVSSLRVAKTATPRLFDLQSCFYYVWKLDDSEDSELKAQEVCRISDMLYQLGCGVDMAWACGEFIDHDELQQRLAAHPGVVYRPCASGCGVPLACPQTGSLKSLLARHAAQRSRLTAGAMRGRQVFTQPPKPRFRQVAYNSPDTLLVYALTGSIWPHTSSAALVELARNAAAKLLIEKLPDQQRAIERALIGRGSTEADKAARVQLFALPSIGHAHADQIIRRLGVRVPPNCPVGRDSIAWAFSGLPLQVDADTGEILLCLVPAEVDTMLRHYGAAAAHPACTWRTVTPVALPQAGSKRSTGADAVAVVQALRHAGLPDGAAVMRVQREPFDVHGQRAEDFAYEPRFPSQRLWHVEVAFKTPVSGPVIIGDGRYLGLGLMRPLTGAEMASGVHCLRIESGLSPAATAEECTRALRRATMSRVQDVLGRRERLPTFFSGHEADGKPSADAQHAHLTFVMDAPRNRMLILAPHRVQGQQPQWRLRAELATLDKALVGMRELRAGTSGCLQLTTAAIDDNSDPLFRLAHVWESVTDYVPTRYVKRVTSHEALIADARTEIARLGRPVPHIVEVLDLRTGPRGGTSGRLRLHFQIGVHGPFVLGRTRHMGGGLFAAVT